MKLIFCVDERGGMMFFGKRQSKDENLRRFIMDYIGDAKLWMSSYSAQQFEGYDNIVADDDYCSKAKIGDFCFIEDKEFPNTDINEIVVCNWNRVYPADKFLDIAAFNLKKQKQIEIAGKSHKKITIEIYS